MILRFLYLCVALIFLSTDLLSKGRVVLSITNVTVLIRTFLFEYVVVLAPFS